MKMTRRIICLFFAVFMCITVFPFTVLAASANPMHGTDVCDDLVAMGYTDYANQYPADSSDDSVHIIDFTEYGYHEGGDQRYYGLYIYVYNPSGKAIQSYGNSIEISYKNKVSSQVRYKKYSLELLDSSDGLTNTNVFHKFLVSSSRGIANDINRVAREYSVSSLEIQYSSEAGVKPESFAIAAKYIFTGYQENFGIAGGVEDSLMRTHEVIEVASIKLNAASWFSDTASLCGEKHTADCKCKDYRWEVSSVYFTVPDYFIRKYGNIADKPADGGTSGLYRVSGEYYKYVTDGIMTDSENAYNLFVNYAGVDLRLTPGYSNSSNDDIGFYHNKVVLPSGGLNNKYNYDFSYNMSVGEFYHNVLYWEISSSNIKNYICNVVKTSSEEKLYVSQDDFLASYNSQGRNHYSSASYLLSYNQDKFKNLGHQLYDITIDNADWNKSFPVYASSKEGFLYKFFNKNLYTDENGYIDCKPLVEVTSSDLDYSSSLAEKADNLFVTEDDLLKLDDFYEANKKDNHVYLMRFEVNPYYCPKVAITTDTKVDLSPDDSDNYDGYYFEKAIFEDFDILEFEFRDKDSKRHIVPVSCKPIDIVGSIIPGNNNITDGDGNPRKDNDSEIDWVKLIMFILAVVIICFIVWIIWRTMGGVITGVVGLGIDISDSRTRRRQQKIDSYDEEQKMKDDKKKKREEKFEKYAPDFYKRKKKDKERQKRKEEKIYNEQKAQDEMFEKAKRDYDRKQAGKTSRKNKKE